MTPKVSIIMATYNRAHFIVETLESIQNQTFEDWECLIIDDGGEDNTKEIISEIFEEDNRFQFCQRPEKYKKGLSGCRNYGLDLAKGDCVIFFDDDDFVHPDNLKMSFEMIIDNDVDFCHYQKKSYTIDKPVLNEAIVNKIELLTKNDMSKIITQEIGLASCTVLWKKKCFEKNRFNEDLQYAEEWECYSRIISEGFNGVVIDTILYYNRKHPNSNTGKFYRNNSVYLESKQRAVLLIVENLQAKNILNHTLMRYFVQLSLSNKEFKLFSKMLRISKINFIMRVAWVFFYRILPYKIFIHKFYKELIKSQL